MVFFPTKCLICLAFARNAFSRRHAKLISLQFKLTKFRLLILVWRFMLAKKWFPRVFFFFTKNPCFPLRPRVFHQTPCFPPEPVFSTPRNPVPRTPGPRPRVFHLAVLHESSTAAIQTSCFCRAKLNS